MFSTPAIAISLFILAVVKPPIYLIFIYSFKYRVNSMTPMSLRHAWRITGVRAILGPAFLVVHYVVLKLSGVADLWPFLMIERAGAWLVVGIIMAPLQGRRLAGWTVGGLFIDAVFDAVIYATLDGSFTTASIIIFAAASVLSLLLVPLHRFGRRSSLRDRFAPNRCRSCGYNLEGNLSGVCPECGRAIARSKDDLNPPADAPPPASA